MDDRALTRSYLETLSTGDLSALADRLGLDLPPDLGRISVVEEILETFHEEDIPLQPERDGDAEGYPENPSEDVFESVSVSRVPDAYYSTFVEVILRDPLWVFVFWEIKNTDRDVFERGIEFSGYRLKVSSLLDGKSEAVDSFYVEIQKNDVARYLCYPYTKGWFKVELCVQKETEDIVLASSASIRIPNGRSAASMESDPSYPMLQLSGLNDMRVVRNVDCASRLLNRCEF